jgi:hypothetical protein
MLLYGLRVVVVLKLWWRLNYIGYSMVAWVCEISGGEERPGDNTAPYFLSLPLAESIILTAHMDLTMHIHSRYKMCW